MERLRHVCVLKIGLSGLSGLSSLFMKGLDESPVDVLQLALEVFRVDADGSVMPDLHLDAGVQSGTDPVDAGECFDAEWDVRNAFRERDEAESSSL